MTRWHVDNRISCLSGAVSRCGGDPVVAPPSAGSPRMSTSLPTLIVAALAEQSVTIPATEQYARVIRGVAQQLLTIMDQREVLGSELEALLTNHPSPRS
jgi:hypothetical protein